MGCGGSCSSCNDEEGTCDRLPPGMLKNYNLNQSIADGTMVWVEVDGDGSPVIGCLEVLAAAKRTCEGRVFAVIFGDAGMKSFYPRIFGAGAHTIYHVRGEGTEVYTPEVYASCLCEVVERIVPATVLFSATPRGRELAPRFAALMNTGVTADCTGMSADDRKVIMTRPAFGGNLIADIECTQFPQVATVRVGAFPCPDPIDGQGTAIYWQYNGGCDKEILSDAFVDEADADVTDAEVILAVGNGVRDKETLELAQRVADKMGAVLCCSRPLVEKGWMPRSRQIGMSGHTVKPKMYIAFGISGAVQHIAGMSGSGKVIAVNNDGDAPIHNHADISLIADAKAVLKAMDSKL